MNCTYVKLGLLLLFLCNRWAQFMAILYGFAARCLFGVVFGLHYRDLSNENVDIPNVKIATGR